MEETIREYLKDILITLEHRKILNQAITIQEISQAIKTTKKDRWFSNKKGQDKYVHYHKYYCQPISQPASQPLLAYPPPQPLNNKTDSTGPSQFNVRFQRGINKIHKITKIHKTNKTWSFLRHPLVHFYSLLKKFNYLLFQKCY